MTQKQRGVSPLPSFGGSIDIEWNFMIVGLFWIYFLRYRRARRRPFLHGFRRIRLSGPAVFLGVLLASTPGSWRAQHQFVFGQVLDGFFPATCHFFSRIEMDRAISPGSALPLHAEGRGSTPGPGTPEKLLFSCWWQVSHCKAGSPWLSVLSGPKVVIMAILPWRSNWSPDGWQLTQRLWVSTVPSFCRRLQVAPGRLPLDACVESVTPSASMSWRSCQKQNWAPNFDEKQNSEMEKWLVLKHVNRVWF